MATSRESAGRNGVPLANERGRQPLAPPRQLNLVRERGERPRLGEEHTIAEALSALDFWLLFSSFLMGVGTGLAVMNNLGQMGVAMGYADVSLFVSMTSIWGFFGRIASGTISEHFIKYVTTTAPLLQLTFLHYYSPQLMNNRRHE
jgi:hypothetical protein